MGWIGIDADTQWLISTVTEWALIGLLIFWWKFEKKESKKRKPRTKRADVQVTVPTLVKVQNGDEDE